MRIQTIAVVLLAFTMGCGELEGSSSSGATAAADGGAAAPELAGTGGAAAPELAGTGGAAAPAGSTIEAPATAACPTQVAGTACSGAPYDSYSYLPNGTHWCVQCYDWPLPPAGPTVLSVDRPIYRSGCLGSLADSGVVVECVTSCSACVPGLGP